MLKNSIQIFDFICLIGFCLICLSMTGCTTTGGQEQLASDVFAEAIRAYQTNCVIKGGC